MPEETRFFLRSAIFGVIITVIYWFVSYETAGTVLLAGFALASALLAAALGLPIRRELRRKGAWRWLLLPGSDEESPYSDERGRIPQRSLAPLAAGAGVTLLALAAVFGPWLALTAAPLLWVGVRGWVRDAMAEFRAVDGDEVIDSSRTSRSPR
jgi:hypothetical protein